MRSVCVAWRFAALVGFIKAGVRDLFADLIHHGVDFAPHHQIVGAPRRHAAQMRHHDANDLIDQGIDIGPAHQLASPLLDPDAQEPRLGFGDTLLRPLIAPTVEPGRAAIADSASGRHPD